MFPVPIGELGASTHLLTTFALLLSDLLSHLQECLGDLEQYLESTGTGAGNQVEGVGEPSMDLIASRNGSDCVENEFKSFDDESNCSAIGSWTLYRFGTDPNAVGMDFAALELGLHRLAVHLTVLS